MDIQIKVCKWFPFYPNENREVLVQPLAKFFTYLTKTVANIVENQGISMVPLFLRLIQRVPALHAFWDLDKTVLHETRVRGTVQWSPTNANSPTDTYTLLQMFRQFCLFMM